MQSHEIDYQLLGEDIQAVEVELDPGESVIAEAGTMNWMDDGVQFETKMWDWSQPDQGMMGKLFEVGKRALTGESLFMTHFTNCSQLKRRIAFAAPYPGKIVPIDLRAHGGAITCEKGSFLCAAKGTKVSIALQRRIGAGFFSGEGFIMQRLEGDGKAFLHSGGTIVRKDLQGGKLFVDTGCVVAYTDGIEMNIERAGNVWSMLFGGEGLFLATLQWTGSVYLQTLPFSRLADRIIAHAPSMGGQRTGEGTVLGVVGDMIGGR